jgi:hypothetical protein
MNKSDAALARKKMVGWLWLAVICFLSLIPLFLVSILANLDAVSVVMYCGHFVGLTGYKIATTGYFGFLEGWSGNSRLSYILVSGVVPPAVSALFTFFLPRIMRWLTQYMGALTHARLDRAVIARYFAFLVISQLIVFTLIGVAFSEYLNAVAAAPLISFIDSTLELVILVGKKKASREAILKKLNRMWLSSQLDS